MTTFATSAPSIDDAMLDRFGARAAAYDAENRFFSEDFEELRASGYLRAAIPQEFGGAGLTLAEVAGEQQRIAYRAPATALAINMHHYWVGVAADMRRMGDASLEWLLRDAAAGEIFAAGHGEAGNDLPLFFSTTSAEPVDGGYRFHGRKQFGSLSPVWTQLGVHGMEMTPAGPRVVHAFMTRDTPGYRIVETWDAMGMRATRSDDTVLEGAFVPDAKIARILPAGEADLFALCIFAWSLTGFASVYLGIARRALDIAIANAHKRTSLGLTRTMAYHPEVQHLLAEAAMELEAIEAQVDRVAADWSAGVDHGDRWPLKMVAMKHRAVEGAKRIVDAAMTTSGGAGMFRGSELERLYRDVRCGGFHPANSMLAHEIVGKSVLGIGMGEQPRWG